MFVVKSEDWYVKFDKWHKRVDSIEDATHFSSRKIADHAAKELRRNNWVEISIEELETE